MIQTLLSFCDDKRRIYNPDIGGTNDVSTTSELNINVTIERSNNNVFTSDKISKEDNNRKKSFPTIMEQKRLISSSNSVNKLIMRNKDFPSSQFNVV